MQKVKISDLNHYLPDNVVDNNTLTNRIKLPGKAIKGSILQRLFGIRERRFAKAEEQVSDLAVQAALPIVEKIGRDRIDCLIFAAACADLIEPATANIVQDKLELNCPVMDIKNACNSFVTAIQVGTSFIQTGQYQNVLIVNGEKLSDTINFDMECPSQLEQHLAAFSFGDAGTAALLSPSPDESGIAYQKFLSIGRHWKLCTIKAGGSLFPRDLSKTFFEGQTAALKNIILKEAKSFVLNAFQESGWRLSDIKYLFTHQVSNDTFKVLSRSLGIPLEKCINIFPQFGNTAAASIPLSMALHQQQLQKGDKIAVVGLAAGVSVSLQLMVW